MTKLTNEERKNVIEHYYERIAEGVPQDSPWRKRLAEASKPQLPDHPTAEQLDAWIELSELLSDESFVKRQATFAREAAEAKLDMLKLRAANIEAARAAAEARAEGASAASDAARDIVERFVAAIAEASGRPIDERLRHGMYERYLAYDPRHPRYWELIAIMTGQAAASGSVADWNFIADAVKVHLAPAPGA